MEFKDVAQIVIEDRTPDGYGGYVTNEVVVGEIKVKTAPYRVAIGEMYAIPNPISSVKFFTNSKLPIDEELVFFVVWNNKKYKKVFQKGYFVFPRKTFLMFWKTTDKNRRYKPYISSAPPTS